MPTSYVNSTLLPDETVIYAAEVHWAVYLKPAFCALLGAIVVAVSPPELAAGMGWLFTFLTALLVINAIVIRTTTEMVITNKRVVSKFGLIRRETFEPQLTQTEGAYLFQSLLGHIFNYGEVKVKGTGGGGALVPFIADPIKFRNTLAALLH